MSRDIDRFRLELRRRRRALTIYEQQSLSFQLIGHLARHPWFRHARRMSAFISHDGEPDLHPLIDEAWRLGKTCCLPVLAPPPRDGLYFVPYRPQTPLYTNRYGIPEPQFSQRVAAWTLDLVLAPLVAFDDEGNRLGMGGGFYDRTLAFTRRRGALRGPRIIGIAYDLQRIDRLPTCAWDVPLHAIATESGVYIFARKNRA